MQQNMSYPVSMLQTLRGVWDEVGAELTLAVLFCAGFMLFRLTAFRRLLPGAQSSKSKAASSDKFKGSMTPPGGQSRLYEAKQLEVNWAAGCTDSVLEAWAHVQTFTLGALRAVVEALVSAGKETEIPATLRKILGRHAGMRTPEAMATALDAVPSSLPDIAAAVKQLYASFRQEAAKREATSCAAQAHIQRIRVALEDRRPNDALCILSAMCSQCHSVPEACLASIVRTAREVSGTQTVLQKVQYGSLCVDAMVVLLEYAVRACDTDLLLEVHQRTESEKVCLPSAGTEAIMRGYASSGDSRAVDVFEDLVRGGYDPPENVLTAAVSMCAESRHIQMAEHIIGYTRRVHGRVALPLYSALVKVYGHARQWHKACDLYEAMREEGVRPDTVVYGSLIKAAVESGRPELARRLFQESGNPDLLNYMSLIRAAGRERDVKKALRLLGELERSPLAADATAYNCALEACAAAGDRAAAEELLQRMEANNQVDVVSYNTYLKVLLGEGAHEEVNRVLQQMHKHNLHPNVVTYNSMVKDAVARQDLQRAWRLADEMERTGVMPDAFTCSILMKAVKHAPCANDVDRIIALVQRAKITPDEVLVNCLLDACVRLRDVQRLTHVLEHFKATGVVPSPHAYATLIRAYGHARRPERAWALWQELTGGKLTAPSEEAFASMVESCLASGDLRGATTVFREVKERLQEFPRAPSVFSALVKACVQAKQARLALSLFDDTREHFACNKVTYNTLIDALVRQADMAGASELFRDMALKNVTPDLITYSTLIKGYCARGDLEQGLQLLSQMQKRGIAPDAILFNSILDGCAHKHMRFLTEQVLRDMEAAGIAPSNFTLSILVKLYGRCSDLDAAFNVVETYPKKYRFELNAQVYTCLMSACIANNDLGRALEVYDSMVQGGCASDAKTYQTLLSGCLRHNDLNGAVRLIDDALKSSPGARLDPETLDSILFMAVRQGNFDLAAPLLGRLQAAGLPISERAAAAVRRHEEPFLHYRGRRSSAGGRM